MKNFISIRDVKSLPQLIERALEAKRNAHSIHPIGANKTLGLIFFNPSLRTRLSSQIAATKLGMNSIVINASQEIWSLEFENNVVMSENKTEHIKDFCKVIDSYMDIVGVRIFPQLADKEEDKKEILLNQFLTHISKPMISLESNLLHPLQSLADVITIEEYKKKSRPKIVLTWAPHVKATPHCVTNSFCQFAHAMQLDVTIAAPKGYEIDKAFAQHYPILSNQEEALKNADLVYVKNWSSTNPYGQVLEKGFSWTLTKEKMALTNNAKVMHCMPIRRNVEMTDEVLDSENCLIKSQAENRIWSCFSVLETILKDNHG